jgi:hypothetical protein
MSMYRPSDFIVLAAALVSFVFSVFLWFTGYREEGLFVAVWVPSVLGLGIYVNTVRNRR